MSPRLVALDHVQLAMPPGGEQAAAEFWSGLLGLDEVPKPPALAARGGCWFSGDGVKVHVGVDADFRPAHKAHPALTVDGLDDLASRLVAAGVSLRWDEEIPDVHRCHVEDPWGNRIELIDLSPPLL